MDGRICQVADLVLKARHAVALTGAGMSTASGIPDFRSPGTGIWTHVDPLSVMSLAAFRADPEGFYRALAPLVGNWSQARPNAAHLALAQLEAWGLVAGIITQNVDNLHQEAGSRRVWELHGHLREATCLRCERVLPLNGQVDAFLESGEAPRCPECGGVLKPNMILFGERLPRYVYMEVMGHLEVCDLVMVAGSSLSVAPASELPFWAHRRGAKVVIINDAPTPADDLAAVVIRDRVERALPHLARACRWALTERPRSVPGGEAGFQWSCQGDALFRLPRLRDHVPGLERFDLPRLPNLPRLPGPPSLDAFQSALWDVGCTRALSLDAFLMSAAQRAAKVASSHRLGTLLLARSGGAWRRAHHAAARVGSSLGAWRERLALMSRSFPHERN